MWRLKVLMEISFDFVSRALYTDPNMTQFHTYCKICDMGCLLLHIYVDCLTNMYLFVEVNVWDHSVR